MKKLLIGILLSTVCLADSPQPFFNAAVTTAVNVKTAPGGVYGLVVGNIAATVCYLQIFNATAANVTLGTTVPALSIPLGVLSATIPGPIVALSFENSPVAFSTAISIAGTTAPTGGTPCGTGLIVNILFL